MSRKWKSGDVALVTFDNATGNQRAQGISRIKTQIALVDTDHVGTTEPAEAWFVFGATSRIGATWESVRDVRPLVVIDPENYQSLLSMVQAMEVHRPGQDITAATDRLQDHLRLIANPKPPRIDEPGTWAVVEASCVHDETARRWVKFPGGNWHTQVTFGQHRSIDNPDDWDSLIDPVLVRDGVDQ